MEQEVTVASLSVQPTDAFPPTYVLYVASVCVLAGIVRLLSRWTVVHHTVIMFGLGAFFGYLSREFDDVNQYVNLGFLTSAKLLQVHTLLLPVIILEYLFSMDPRVFLSCSPLAVITVVLDYSLTLLVQGAFIFYFLDLYDLKRTSVKTVLIYLLFGSLTSVTDTSYVVNTFNKMGSYWILVKLLEMKRVISLVGACVVYIFVVYVNEFNYEIEWHNVVIFIVLQFFVSPALGWLTAQIMIFWLGRLYNDIGVEITVSIAVAYLLYYFGTVNIAVKPMVSAIAVVVYALLLNNRRTCFSLGLDTFLYKLTNILAYVVKTVIFTIAGFIITNEDISSFGQTSMVLLPHILISLTLYSWCMLSRGFVCLLLAPALRRCGYVLSWQELSTMVFCNVTGTVCMITAVASCNVGLVGLFYNDRHIQYMLMFHLGVLAVIRSLVAGTMFRHVLMALGMRHVSLGRYVAMNNALQKVQEQIRTSARSYKFDRFLADADWDTVYEFTNFDEPYKDISRYSVIGRAMDLNPDLLGDVRLNMLHAKRMSFWRQYEQGLLSLRALRILLEECYLAEWNVTTSGYDIGDQIRKHYQIKKKGMFSVLQILKEKFEHIQELRRQMIADVMLVAKSRWKRFVYKVSFHVSIEVILIVAAVLTSIVSVFVLLYEFTCPEGWNMTIFLALYDHIDIAFMVFYTVYIILKLYVFKWRYLMLFGSLFNISLLITGWIDVILHSTGVLKGPNEVCDELAATHWAITFNLILDKFFIICRCLRLLIVFEDKTYFFVHAMKKRMLLRLQLGYDVGKAYVYCKEEVVRTAGEFISESRTLDDIRKQLQTTRVQLMRELATVQKKYPGIVVSVKSQEACRRILHVAKETITQLQRNGRVDSYEAGMLDEMVKLRLKRLNQIPAQIELPSVDTLISKLSWVNGDENLMTFLHFNSKLFNMAEGESVDFDCDPTAGLYVLVSGLIRVNWSIGEPYGRLKQSSHVQSEATLHSVDTTQLHDYMTTGSTFGELALLTETPIAIDAVCETTVLMYHIQYESVRTALDWVTEPPLDWRLWLNAAVRLSVPLLKALPAYYNSSLEDVKVLTDCGSLIVQRLESQFSDDSSEEKFNLTRHASNHVILIHGTASKTGETYTGPIIIPPDNDDLVFSSVYCDLFVLYIVPHRTAASGASAFAAPVASLTPSEISTIVELPKESPGHAAASRPAAPKKRGRATSVAGTAVAAVSSPLRYVDEELIAVREKDSLSESDRKSGLKEIGEVPEEESIQSDNMLLFPLPIKPDLTPEAPVAYSSPSKSVEPVEPIESVKSVESVAPVEAVKEEVTEPPVSPPQQMAVAQDEPVETKTEDVTTVSRESTPVAMLPRKSASEILVRPHPWTEAWKYVLPQIQPTLTLGNLLLTQTTSSTPAPPTATRQRDAAAQTIDAAAGHEDAGIGPTSAPRQVTDASTTQPPKDVGEENKSVNNSVNNNNSNSNNNNIDDNGLHLYPQESEQETSMLRMRSKDATVVPVPHQSHQSSGRVSRSSVFRLVEGSTNESAAEDRLPRAASARSGERPKMPPGPVDDTKNSPTIVDDEVAPELLERSKVPTPGGLVLDDNDDVIDSGLFPSDTAANSSTSPTSRDIDSWILTLQMQSRSVTASYAATRKDLNEDRPTFHVSDKSQTVYRDADRTSEVLTGKVATESKRADMLAATDEMGNAVPGSRVVNAAAMKSHYGSEQNTVAKTANVKSDASKMGLPDTVTTKPTGKTAVEWPRQRTKTLATMSDNTRNVRATDTLSPKAAQDSETARSGAASFAISGRASSRGENYNQPVRYVLPRRPSSSRPAVAGADAQSRNRGVRRGINAGGKPAAKSDSREKKPPTTDGGRASRTPADSTTSAQVDVSCEDDDEDQSDS